MKLTSNLKLKKQAQTLIFYFYNILIICFVSIIFSIPYFTELNSLFIDKLQGNIEARPEIVIVGIDDKSLNKIGAWPWDRSIFGTAISNLNTTKPKVLGVDILFLEDRVGDEGLSSALKSTSFPTIFASKIIENDNLVSKFSDEKNQSGFINFFADSDGKIRETLVSRKQNNDCIYSFTYQIFKGYLGTNQSSGCESDIRLNGNLNFKNELYFNYTSSDFSYLSFSDLYENNFDKDFFKNKIVLLGSTAIDLKSNLNDNFTDVFGKNIPGIAIHANIINSFLENKFQHELAKEIFYPSIMLLSSGLLFVYRKLKNNKIDLFIFVLTLAIVNIIGIGLFDIGVNWPFIITNFILLTNYIYMLAFKYFVERKENRFIQKAFSQYLNEKLLKQLVEKPELLNLGGEKKVMTVLFSDIRGFTNISEKLTPEELISLINDYLNSMSEVILDNNGTIDKFIGDAIMALWNAPLEDPKHQIHAIKTALKMEETLVVFNKKRGKDEELHIGIGINTGDMVVGNVGSHRRFDYTVLGDNVNLASRLESLTKKYGIGIIASESVIENLEIPSGEDRNIIFRLLDEVIVKGKSKPVKIFEPMYETKSNLKLKNDYEKAFDLYQKGKFDEAIKIFSSLDSDKTSGIMIERIQSLPKEQMESWNGVWTWAEK
jgi:adenylate cyclase